VRLDGGNQCTGVSLGWKSYQMHGLQRCRKGSGHETHCLAWELAVGGFDGEKCTIQLARPGEGMHGVSTQPVSIAFHLTARASDVSLSYMYD